MQNDAISYLNVEIKNEESLQINAISYLNIEIDDLESWQNNAISDLNVEIRNRIILQARLTVHLNAEIRNRISLQAILSFIGGKLLRMSVRTPSAETHARTRKHTYWTDTPSYRSIIIAYLGDVTHSPLTACTRFDSRAHAR